MIVNDDDAACVSPEMIILLGQLQDQLDMPSAEINDSEVLEKLPAEYEEWVKAQTDARRVEMRRAVGTTNRGAETPPGTRR